MSSNSLHLQLNKVESVLIKLYFFYKNSTIRTIDKEFVMKVFMWIFGTLVILFAAVFTVAFTPFGNSMLQPTIEAKIKEQTHLDTKLKTFVLNMSEINILLELNKNNTINVKGHYSLFSKSVDVKYSVKLEELKTLQPLTQVQLQSSLHTNGTVKGNMHLLHVDGVSDLASSDTLYHIQLTQFNPSSIIAKIKNANLAQLLYLGNQKAYAKANINLDINFKNITPHHLDGDIALATDKGKIDTHILKKDFNLTLPQTKFTMDLHAKLQGDDVNYKYNLNSNLAKIYSKGKITPEPLKMNLSYGVNIKELAILKPIANVDVRGPFKVHGVLNGSKEHLVVDGKSDIASSKTSFQATLKNFQPSHVAAHVKHLQLSKLLYMIKQPHYADALFAMNANLTNLKIGALQGVVTTEITKGLVDSNFITKEYKFKTKMPKTNFTAQTKTELSGNIANSKIDVLSSLADLHVKQAQFNIKDASLMSDYLAKVPVLERLYFATEQHMRGGITANGELKKAKDLDFTLHSNVVGGNIDAKLHNDDFHADLKSLQTLQALHMLIYPEVFKSTLEGVVDYNLVQQKGTFKADLKDGKFTRNQVLSLVKQFAHIDMYKQRFKGTTQATIHKEKIVASLDLRSNTSSIKTKDTKLNSKTKQIHSKLDIVANNHPLSMTLTGKATAPHVKVDAHKIIKKEAEKVIKKKLGNILKGFF